MQRKVGGFVMGKKKKKRNKKYRPKTLKPSEPKADLPDWRLAKLQCFDPNLIFNDKSQEHVDAFFLALAILFNDLKDLMWWSFQLGTSKISRTEVSASAGQLSGMINHADRLMVGLINELLDLLKARRAVLNHQTFQSAVSHLKEDTRSYLDAIISIALTSNSTKKDPEKIVKFRRALTDVRNKGAFHYSDLEAFTDGYRFHFSDKNPIDAKFREQAFISDGANAEETRFYYADAAIGGMVQLKTSESVGEDYHKLFKDLAQKINQTLKPLIVHYLNTKKRPAK